MIIKNYNRSDNNTTAYFRFGNSEQNCMKFEYSYSSTLTKFHIFMLEKYNLLLQ